MKDGFRTGVIALTETRLVYLRKKKSETFVDRATDRNAITDFTYKRSWGHWWLEFKDGSDSVTYLENGDDFQPFVEPLLESAAENELEDEGVYDGHDTTILGEQALLVAKASGGFPSGVLALTDTRLVYLRKTRDNTFIDREHPRTAVTDVTYKKSLGSWQLGFKDRNEPIFYNQNADDLEPFVEPLTQSAPTHEQLPGTARNPGLKYQGYDLTILGGWVLLAAKASRGRHSGVIALTNGRLVYLRKVTDNTFIDREHSRNAITDVTYKKSLRSWQTPIQRQI